jgi:hypothetical protein
MGRWDKHTICGMVVAIVLVMAFSVFAQDSSVTSVTQAQTGEASQLLPVTTIAVCGYETCDCGSARLVTRNFAPCTVTATTGSCSVDNGACCICEATDTFSVCGEETCTCGDAVQITKLAAPCTVTATTGSCTEGAGECCVCKSN